MGEVESGIDMGPRVKPEGDSWGKWGDPEFACYAAADTRAA